MAARKAQPSPQAGFTLVEMMVALLVFALIAVAGSAMTRFVLSGRSDLADRQARAAELQTARAILRADLLNAVARPARDSRGVGGRGFTGGAGALTGGAEGEVLLFLRAGWENPGALEDRGPLLHVAYVLNQGRLLRRATLRPDPTPQTPVAETVLIEGVQGIALEFLAGSRWLDGWGGPAAAGQAARLPDAVALDLDLAGLGHIRQLFLTGEAAR
ncbi:type II secretion system minor pseudopilin GspJ [Indioceanicola profundi]|uniref:type II secretion system minor pseudopilin GspJ n=1 Tax=Indioceanicola profundi TaxID=2220096 RepID=UPI000E6AE001|nr:type II secretion system minor pseudopilin GspJ [Indioceanicola profundi]